MVVKVGKKDWDINDCTYAERRELHKLNAKVWWDGKMDVESYYEVLERVGARIWIWQKSMKSFKRFSWNTWGLNRQKKIPGVEPCGLVLATWLSRTA